MVSKNNFQQHQQAVADRVPHYGLRKLSIGVASVLLSTTLYMGVTAHADTTVSTSPQPTVDQPANTTTGTSTSDVTADVQPTTGQPASTVTPKKNDASAKSAPTALPKQPANATDAQPTADHSSRATNSPTPENDMNVKSAPTALPNQPANADTQSAATTSGVQPFVNLAVESDNNDLAPKKETVDSTWTLHYVNQADHKQELKAPTVITMQYTRTNTPQSDGTTKYGDWSYVPGSFKQTGTQITVNDSNNPVKQGNVDKDGENMDVFTITAMYPTITGYTMHNNINGTRLHDYLRNNDRQADSMSKDFYAEYDVAKERSVSVKFVDDQSYDPGSSDGKTQVGQAITLTGRDGDTVKVNVTVPDKYQLADGQQLPTTYTFAKGSGDVTIHLVHKVVQREAAIDAQLGLITLVRTRGDDGEDAVQGVVTQTRWKQLEDSLGNLEHLNISFYGAEPLVEVGTLTGHVDYDLVDETVVSLKNDWTSLNLSGHSYELPNGTEVVNGIRVDADDTFGKKLRDDWYLNEYRKWHHDVDPDYITRPWHGYLSVNETNNEHNSDYGIMSDVHELGLQAGLVGDEPNALAKAIGDRAATAVEMSNITIDSNLLQTYDFSEQNGQLRAKAFLPVAGIYIPYVEKTATRTINVTTPDGKTKTVKQTATLAKQVDFADDAHPAWTTGEWANYTAPSVPGYTASQSNVAKETVTGTTEDQTVNITYTANPQTSTVVYQTEDGTPVHTTTVNGHTGQTVKVSNEVPVGWHVVNGTVPSEITFGPNGAPKTVVTIAHSHATVTPDAPKTTGDKLPDNPDKTYPTGVGETDLNKTVTRTIKVTVPDGQTKTIAQTAKLTRTADVDEVTGEVKYSDWTTGKWAKYDVPSVPGYTASQSSVAQQTVTDATQDQTIDITYTANDHQISVEYVDNATGKILKTDHVSGKTGQIVSITPNIPDGWELISGQSVPSEVTLGADGAPATVIKVQPQERSVAVKFVDDQSYVFNTSDHKKQVGQAITVTGRDGDTVDLKLTVPDKYQLADGQQLPTTYTFAKGSGDLKIHLVHKVVQLKATVDVKLYLMTAVRVGGGDYGVQLVVTQDQWKQLEAGDVDSLDELEPSVKAGTLTGHVNYDLVYGNVVSFGDDWTSLNLGGQTYQLPNGDEVVNGVITSPADYPGETLKEYFLKNNTNTDSDYVNRPWHGYLSVNATNNNENIRRIGLQAGLVGDESNALAKATGDHAATGIEMANKTIDLSWLQGDVGLSLPQINEQDGQVKYNTSLNVAGVYVPYVEKTATRTINVTAPDGKTTAVKQTATLAKQVDFGKDAHPAWTTGEWANYDVPAIPGYTASQSQVAKETVTGTTKDQTVNVSYTPDAQKLSVKFVDDTTGQVLKTVTKTGVTNAAAGYNTQSDIQSYEGQHYVLVSDSSNGANLVFDDNDSTDQAYEVHLKHGTHQIDEHHTIMQTVHYIATDHVSVPDDHTVSVQFDRDGYHDEVTGTDHWNDWKQGGTQTFTEVPTPKKAGYTPDIETISAVTVKPTDPDQKTTVTYTPDTQKLDIVFIDDTTGKTLKTVAKSGPTNSNVGYNTKSDINSYEGQHYVLVSDSSNGASLAFDDQTGIDQHYEVHLKHGTHQVSDRHIITETVHYKMADGTQAPEDHTANVQFDRTGSHDEVTGVDTWNAWTPSATQQFAAVPSPAVLGYTPDTDQVAAQTVGPDAKDTAVTVTYSPNVQIAHVKYVDDTDHKVLTQDDLNGRTGETSGYHTTDRIIEFKGQRYKFVSDNYPVDGMAFDSNDHVDQQYEVHLVHDTRTDEQDVNVPRTITYVYQSGQQAQPDHTDSLKFHETKVVDLVDGHTVSDAWTQAQDFETVTTPTIQGYTPDRASVSNIGITHGHPAITEKVTYNPDAQKAVVKYIDDTTGEQLSAKDLSGYSDESTGYTTKDAIDGYTAKRYVLVSDGTQGQTIALDHDDSADQVYEVHFKHGTEPTSESRTKKIVVHYSYVDGLARTGKAADDQIATDLTFSRTGTHDLVTDHIAWNAWDKSSQTFDAINSPAIQGYTPDRTVIDNVKVNPDSHDLTEVTVTYNADSQKLSVDFIDDTTGKTLKTINKIGYSDENAGYNTKSDIQDFISKHYDLISDQTNGENLVFDHDDKTDQHYEVHLTHATKPISEAKSTNETIRYQLADGTKAFDDYTAKVNFSRTGFNDLVTNIDHWNDWTPAVKQSFNTIQSPVKQGYTPDHAQIDAITVHPGDADTARTVIYSPDAQTVTIDYLDDVTGKTLQTKTITGVSDVDTGYTTAETINNYEGQHYKLVSDNTNGDQLVFDHDDTTDQHYEVHLTHTYKSVNDSATVNEAIHYQYADGTQAKHDHKAEALNFSRTGTQDLVDNSIAWNAWTPDQQTFVGVDTPAVGGYTPDIETVAPATVSHDTPDVERTVIYHADDQTILVHYIDDDTQSTLKTDSIIGKTSQKSGYKTGKTIDGYKQAGYDLVSDDTNGDELVFDNDSTKAQVYNVHLKHRHQAASDSDTVKQTVHYVYNDGSKAADDYTATPIEFTRTGDTDLVTGKTTWNAWTPTSQTFKAVPSPVIAGYTPGRATIDHIDVHAGDPDIDETVTYVPDAQRIVVNYIDSVTHQTLKTDTLDGRSDQSTNYNTQKNIDGYKNQHYALVSDDTQGQNLVFDHDDQATQTYDVVLGHETETVHRAHTVSETIDYKYADGTKAAPTKTAEPKTFSQSGVHDVVTNTTDWNGQWSAPQTFNAVESPKITGFTPDHAVTEAVTVDHDSQDVYKLVVYTANKQAAKINYVDDVTGKTLETATAAGHFGEQISFGRDVNDQIKQFENQGYKLVSNNFNGQKYQADDSNNVFEVHLTHQHQAVSESDTVTETVKYQYADGTQAAKDSTQSAEFTRTGDKDLVTGTIVWMPSTETHQFDAVDSPAIDGFTPDVQSVPAATVKFGDRDITKVATYTANDQNAGIKIIDDTTGDVLNTQTATGKFGQTIEFKTDPDTQVADFHGQGYELVSDNFSHQKYQSDNTKNQFEIHVRHQTVPATRTSTVTETVHYRDRNGNRLVPDTHETKTFTETGVTDKVTGKTTWTPTGTQTFDSVKVPTVTGYTPDRTEIPSADVRFGDHNIDETVIYTPDSETAQIKYIDDVTGNVLLTDNTSGDYGSTIEFDHNPSSQINQYESQGYKLVSNSYGDGTHQFSATPSENQFEVHLTHQTKDVSRTKTVTRTINYVDAQTGNKLRPLDQQTLTFTEHGTMDLVTGKTTWVTAPVQHFAKVAVPDIDGYTHQMQIVDSQTADFDSDDFEVTVPYTKVQTPNVPDTGTPTGSQSTPGTVTPTGGEDIPTGTQTISGQRQVISTADEPQHQPVQNNSQAQTLPQTGNSEQNGTALAGLGLIGMVGSLFGFKKKRD